MKYERIFSDTFYAVIGQADDKVQRGQDYPVKGNIVDNWPRDNVVEFGNGLAPGSSYRTEQSSSCDNGFRSGLSALPGLAFSWWAASTIGHKCDACPGFPRKDMIGEELEGRIFYRRARVHGKEKGPAPRGP